MITILSISNGFAVVILQRNFLPQIATDDDVDETALCVLVHLQDMPEETYEQNSF